MKEEALAIAAGESDPARKLNLLREYLQALSLRSLHESEAFANLAFVGGTALRIVHALPRFSEDLDFSLHREEAYRPETWMRKLKNDLSSLMAGKVHALLTRPYAKGRDWYDLLWYRGHRPPLEPNLVLLRNALDQSQGDNTVAAPGWKSILAERIRHTDNQQLIADVAPFLERPQEADLLRAGHILSVLE